MAIVLNNSQIFCELVPHDSENIVLFLDIRNTYLNYESHNKVFRIIVHYKPSTIYTLHTVILKFKVVIAGDLSFYTTATGHDDHSHARCPYCDLTISTWTNKTVNGTPLTLSSLHHYASLHKNNPRCDSKGVIMNPQILVEPAMYIVPILHLLIGIVNKIWLSMCYFLDKFVELVTSTEADLKEKCQLYEQVINDIKDEIDIHTVNKNYACAEANTDPDAKKLYQESCENLKSLEADQKILAKNLKEIKGMLEIEKKIHINNKNGIYNHLYAILEGSKISRQTFHGGSMNGVSC